jgi:SEC-C motif domain protein
MKEIDKYSPCPCDSKKPYHKCCRPFHQGAAPPTALGLMRSRYCAYALGLVEYIMATTHSQNVAYTADRTGWGKDLERFCQHTDFDGLKILQVEEGAEEATVSFTAYLRQGESDASFSEKSSFSKEGDRWLYRCGEIS